MINAGSGRNTASEDKFPRCVLPRRFDFGGSTAMIYKDVKLCLDEAEALGVPMMVGGAVKHAMGIGKATWDRPPISPNSSRRSSNGPASK